MKTRVLTTLFAAAMLLTATGCRCCSEAGADGEELEITETVTAVDPTGNANAAQTPTKCCGKHGKHHDCKQPKKECQSTQPTCTKVQ